MFGPSRGHLISWELQRSAPAVRKESGCDGAGKQESRRADWPARAVSRTDLSPRRRQREPHRRHDPGTERPPQRPRPRAPALRKRPLAAAGPLVSRQGRKAKDGPRTTFRTRESRAASGGGRGEGVILVDGAIA